MISISILCSPQNVTGRPQNCGQHNTPYLRAKNSIQLASRFPKLQVARVDSFYLFLLISLLFLVYSQSCWRIVRTQNTTEEGWRQRIWRNFLSFSFFIKNLKKFSSVSLSNNSFISWISTVFTSIINKKNSDSIKIILIKFQFNLFISLIYCKPLISWYPARMAPYPVNNSIYFEAWPKTT